MTDAEFRKAKSRVLSAYKKWAEATGMKGWSVRHDFFRDGTAGSDTGASTLAQASVRWEYLQATFRWNLWSLSEETDERLDLCVRHEICHALVNETRMWWPPTLPERELEEAIKHEERVVTVLASILGFCREAGRKDASPKRKKRRSKS